MKDGLENIDEVFKQAFDGFEANVDPSVWNNVQNSINSGAGSTPQIDPTTVASVAGKSLALKIVAGVALLATVATTAYFIPDLFGEKEAVIVENVAAEDNVIIEDESSNSIIENNNTVENNESFVEEGEVNVIDDNISLNSNKIEKTSGVSDLEDIANNEANNGISDNDDQKGLTGEPLDSPANKPNVKAPPVKTFKVTKKDDASKLFVKINVDIVKGKAPLTVQFDAIGNGVQYFWDFSDGGGELGDAPVHSFIEEGTYTVRLKGIDENGNSKEDAITIIVEKDHSSSIQPLQNVFSPNGDGINDIIKIKGKNIDKVQVKIVDSKGSIVYFMNSLDDIWDGKDQGGNYLIQGQYYMTVVAIGKDGKRHLKKSVVNLRK